MTWVFENSPYTLGARLIHLAIADIVNDDNDWLLWASQKKLGAKAMVSQPTVSGTLKRMCKEGYLELVEEGHGAPSIYRFLRPGQSESDSPSPKEIASTPKGNLHQPPKLTEPVLLPTQIELNVTQHKAISSLCEFLQDGIQRHRGTRPKQTTAWVRDMDLLLRRGPKEWEEVKPLKADEVASVIRGIFTKLNVESSSGFCWANQIRSPGNLRRHWDELTLELRDKPRAKPVTGQNTNILWQRAEENHRAAN